jgi:arginase
LHDQGRLGLLWLDAHMDSHTFRTTPSQAIHGMPLACLLGHGDGRLTHISGGCPKLNPQDVCLLGVRSYESEEAALLASLGVRIFFMDDIRQQGFEHVFHQAWAHVTRFTQHVGISIDLDVLDPQEEAGVGSPVPGGVRREDLVTRLNTVHADPRLRVLEIMEYNPYWDRCFATAHAIHDICASVVK